MHAQRGFSLIELMIVVALIAIMATIGVPSFQSLQQSSRMTSASNNLLGALQYARSEAVTQRTSITVSPLTGNDWTSGTQITKGATKLREAPAAATGVTITGSANSLTYRPDGSISTSATFSIQSSGQTSRQIKVNTIGQACAGSSCS